MIFPGGGDLARGAVGQPAVGTVVVAVDVGADRSSGLVDGLELLARDAALLELAEPGLDEALAPGIAVAAATVDDPELVETGAERAT